ncbi:integral membrane protein DUF92-domain-containing protein [Leucosporidium creatinivorum]|uniref:Integral membrane protein DUF92-domain-containing protein n=1 Tax=Leucosporidium creatinivorum TaxID=106004 RepID=A0A1Y2DDN7_9BASI|nr:integral membrane protein DUF92-domain-containing protein [Leucosporidium creatinivorum]
MATFFTTPMIVPYYGTAAFATILGLHGKRSGSLSTSGAIAAAVLGYAALGNPLAVFGVAMLTMYFAGSRATKVKAAHKATLEEYHATEASNGTIKAGGNRDAVQVLANGLFGAACAVAWRVLYSGEFADGKEWTGRLWMGVKGERWCAVDARWGWSKALILGAVAFWGACAGDTFASELGMLSTPPPVLITTLRTVPRGTNGGVSPWGLLVSLLGGLLVGTTTALSLAYENPECAGFSDSRWGLPWWALVVGVGGWSGLVGSLVDSFLGATVQQSLYSSSRLKIVHSRAKKDEDDVVANVPGSGFNLITNNGVNLVSAAGTAAFVVWWASPGL